MYKKYLAEFIGTFALAFAVLLSVASGSQFVVTPVVAALVLGLFVYSIGAISGCHINPSVTLGQLFVKKISSKDAGFYIIAQLLGGIVAMMVASSMGILNSAPATVWDFSGKIFFVEMLGAFFFNFGIASVVYGKAKEQLSGVVVGGSLLLGILISLLGGAGGILNPAVALALNSLTLVYVLAPVVGAVIAFQVYRYLAEAK